MHGLSLVEQHLVGAVLRLRVDVDGAELATLIHCCLLEPAGPSVHLLHYEGLEGQQVPRRVLGKLIAVAEYLPHAVSFWGIVVGSILTHALDDLFELLHALHHVTVSGSVEEAHVDRHGEEQLRGCWGPFVRALFLELDEFKDELVGNWWGHVGDLVLVVLVVVLVLVLAQFSCKGGHVEVRCADNEAQGVVGVERSYRNDDGFLLDGAEVYESIAFCLGYPVKEAFDLLGARHVVL